MPHTLHKPTTTQSECQAVVSAAKPPSGNGISPLSEGVCQTLLTDHSSSSPPIWAASTTLNATQWCLPHSQEALAALVLSAVPQLLHSPASATPGRGHCPGCQGRGHWVLQVLQKEARVFCCVTLQTGWHQNSSGQSMEGNKCLCPDKKTASKNKEVWQRRSVKQ